MAYHFTLEEQERLLPAQLLCPEFREDGRRTIDGNWSAFYTELRMME